jgi:UDP-N-acetyl-D-galactosamine dehydrogenase
MGAYVAEELVKGMLKAGLGVKDAQCLVLGFTFKENCPDVRNTRVIDIIRELESYGMQVIAHDPWVQAEEVAHEYGGLVVHSALPQGTYDAVVLAVAHREFQCLDLRALTPQGLVFDVKGLLPKGASDWRL